MEGEARTSAARQALPVILLAAVIQGWALYGLHHAVKARHWPATDQPWLIALYTLAVFIPLSVQLLAEHARTAALWRLAAVLGAAYFYFGWHQGSSVSSAGVEPFTRIPSYFSIALLLTILWLMALPFAQIRLTTGHWGPQYHALFANAWRNKLMLAEASLFTGLFWLLLFLWQMLFHMLGIDFFRELFEEPIFVYPVTSLAFGCALHLIGSIERLTSVVLEQILNVLKWLGLLAGVILAFFTIALVFKLPGLLFTGQKAIGAAWLLWLTAVVVLLLNAAYRDGSVPEPYPKWIARFLRWVVPLTVIISLTALYALLMRTRYYGLTVERVWAFVVAGAALLYSVGYSISAVGGGAWLGGIARVNVAAAIALMAVISAALTPVLSPYRLAANSQYRLVLAQGPGAAADKGANANALARNTPMQYLGFESGQYGRARLQELAQLQTGADAEEIRRLAKQLLGQSGRWEAPHVPDAAAVVAKLRIFPVGRSLDRDLAEQLLADLRKPRYGYAFQSRGDDAAGIYIDLKGDGSDEFVFLDARRGLVYENRGGRWTLAGDIFPQPRSSSPSDFAGAIIAELAKGNVSATAPTWKELSIGGHVFRVTEVAQADRPVNFGAHHADDATD
jgi:Domain of unknown function (DUF4153)